MESEGLTFDDASRRRSTAVAGLRVHVLGDTIVDSYVYCTPIGSSTGKTPTLSVKLEEQVDFAGGAAVVARHIRAGGRRRHLLDGARRRRAQGFRAQRDGEARRPLPAGHRSDAADDAEGGVHRQRLPPAESGPGRQPADLGEDRRPVRRAALAAADVDAYVFSDFRHGIFSKQTIPELTGALRPGPLRVADSQVASRWGNILDFHGFDLITPNEKEARFSLADQDSVVRPLALELYKRAGCKALILKMGERGIITYREPSPRRARVLHRSTASPASGRSGGRRRRAARVRHAWRCAPPATR